MKFKKNILFVLYLGIIFFLFFEILFSEKSIFTYFQYSEIISSNSKIIENKKVELQKLNSFLRNFENSSEFKELVVKDKLFYKNKNEKVVLYNFNY